MASNKNIDFLVIGAQKCATTWIYHCLKEHPEIRLPRKKQEIGYIGGELFQEHGEDWFFQRYDEDDLTEKVKTGDVSVDYLYDPSSAKALKPYADKAKFIASLRNPVDRLVSGYFWFVRKGFIPNLPIEEGLAPILNQPVGFTDKLEEPYHELVTRGFYANQLKGFIQEYEVEQFRVFDYEQIKNDSKRSIQDIYKFIGVDAEYVPSDLNKHHHKNSYNKLLIMTERLGGRKYLLGRALGKIAHNLSMAVGDKSKAEPQLSTSSRKKLYQLYTPQMEETREFLRAMPKGCRPDDAYIKNMWLK